MPGFRAAVVGAATIASQGLATTCVTSIRRRLLSAATVVCPIAAQGVVEPVKVPFAMSWAAAEAGGGTDKVATVRTAANAAALAVEKSRT
ncbi:hypothetical protein GCM10009850_072910 [Nonomuraea monospora]|uniref:Secreted protein n=1 Tax=Nonomuraea monospora TaxID=568818 RepID=A0ABP5PJB3_9ACTN